MDAQRQREAISRLTKEEMKDEINDKIDSETLRLIDNSMNINYEIHPGNYKWCKSGEDDEYNNFPFKKWELKNFFYELSQETEITFLSFSQDMGVERLLLSTCKVLRCFHTIKPNNSDDLIDNVVFIKLIEQIQCIESPYISKGSDLWYVVDLPSYQRNMLMSVSRYIEGLIYSKVSPKTFKRIKDNPFRGECNPYRGFELLYTILNGDRTFQRVREAQRSGISIQQLAGAYCRRGSPIPPELLRQIKKKIENDKKVTEHKKEMRETHTTNFLVDDRRTLSDSPNPIQN